MKQNKDNSFKNLCRAMRRAARVTQCLVHQSSQIHQITKQQKNRKDRKQWKNKFRNY